MAKNSNTMLNKSGESGHPCLGHVLAGGLSRVVGGGGGGAGRGALKWSGGRGGSRAGMVG